MFTRLKVKEGDHDYKLSSEGLICCVRVDRDRVDSLVVTLGEEHKR